MAGKARTADQGLKTSCWRYETNGTLAKAFKFGTRYLHPLSLVAGCSLRSEVLVGVTNGYSNNVVVT